MNIEITDKGRAEYDALVMDAKAHRAMIAELEQFRGSGQTFHAGDLVRVAKDLGPHMSHFRGDCDAVVVGSYADQYGCQPRQRQLARQYTLRLEGAGRASWYDEEQLTLIHKAGASHE